MLNYFGNFSDSEKEFEMLNDGDFIGTITMLILANSDAMLQKNDESGSPEETIIWENLRSILDGPIFWVMKDKKVKIAQKSLAKLGCDKFSESAQKGDYRLCRWHLTEATNDIFRISIGDEAMDIIMEELGEVFALIKSFDDLHMPANKERISDISQKVKKRLLMKGYYSGSLT